MIEEWISDLEDRVVEITLAEQKKIFNKDHLSLWDNIKHCNICIIGIPEERERQKTFLK